MIVGKCGNPDGTSGITDASTIVRLSVPWTRPAASTTAPSSGRGPHRAGADDVWE
jgi:hypothetical protein